MVEEIQTAAAKLWHVELETTVGGSGVNAVDVIVVDLKTKAGLTGRGFSYVLGSTGRTATIAARELIESFIINKPLPHPELLAKEIRQSFNRTGRGPNVIAQAAIDTAIWDLYAKSLDCSVGVAMGGKAREVPVYGSGGFNTIQSPEEAAEQAQSYLERGVRAVKPRVAGSLKDEKVIEAVRYVIEGKADLMLDANEKCDQASAIRLMEVANNNGVLFVEEPLPAQNLSGYLQISKRTSCAIALGEHLQGVSEAYPFMADGICNIIQPDLAMMGGLTECLRIVRYAEIIGTSVAPHFLPHIFIHLAAVSSNITWLEDFPLLEPIFGNPQTFNSNGVMTLNGLPGLGLEWDEGAERQYKVDF
jgi:L-alanine-DL-glutamate epimerase-like enolase superfamily enzyme